MSDHEKFEDLYDAVDNAEAMDATTAPKCFEITQIKERYSQATLLGRGGLKAVYSVFDKVSQRFVALAEPREGLHPLFYDLIVREARLTSKLTHPNIVTVFDVGIRGGDSPYFTMELKGGQSLNAWIASQSQNLGALDRFILEDRLMVFRRICNAIAYAHSQQILHCDLKAENIQIDGNQEVMVCDWGLGRELGEEIPLSESADFGSDGSTLHGWAQGTPAYMAPEQMERDCVLDQKADIYGLGALLYFMVTGATAPALEEGTRRSELRLNAVPRTLRLIIKRAMAIDPADRYSDVDELAQDVTAFVRGQSTRFDKSNPFRVLWLGYLRNQLRWNGSLVLLALILGGIVSVIRLAEDLEEKRERAEERANVAEDVAQGIQADLDIIQKGFAHVDPVLKKRVSRVLDRATTELSRGSDFSENVRAFEMLEALALLSGSLGGDDPQGLSQLMVFKLIQMDFVAAKYLADSVVDEALVNFVSFCPDFSYSKSERPDLETLTEFLRGLRMPRDEQSVQLVEQMITYDLLTRIDSGQVEDVSSVLKAFYAWFFEDSGVRAFSYDPHSATLTLRVEGDLNYPNTLGLGHAFLRFLSVKNLVLVGKSPKSLRVFRGSNVASIDISQLDVRSVVGLSSLTGLQELIVSEKQVAFSKKMEGDGALKVVRQAQVSQ
ncbi:MAG: serine/threonine-protein kinase [Opitutales bacterium]